MQTPSSCPNASVGIQSEAAVQAVNRPVRVSVIIPALNEEEMIGKCLTSLAASHCVLDTFEVVLVDNGSTDRTVEVARSFSSRLRLTVLQRPGVNISGLRNFGASLAQGEFLAFLDADCLVPPNWIENACTHLGSESSGVIGGNIDIPNDSLWVAQAWYKVGYAPKNGEVTYVPSGNMLMRRSSFLRIGGFDESLKTSEDCELCFRARREGLAVRSIAEMAVIHLRTPQTLAEFYRRERWHGTHVAKVFVENFPAMANFQAVAFAAYMLVLTASSVLGVILALCFHRFAILSVSGFGLIAGPAFCSVRKLHNVRGKDFWTNLIPLTVLHLVWGLARARALLSVQNYYPRKNAT